MKKINKNQMADLLGRGPCDGRIGAFIGLACASVLFPPAAIAADVAFFAAAACVVGHR